MVLLAMDAGHSICSKAREGQPTREAVPMEQRNNTQGSLAGSELERLFPGDSEMAGRMRAFDWSKTDLGPPKGWPENLRVAVSLCLTSRFPILLWWGANL